jgi:MFS family permease
VLNLANTKKVIVIGACLGTAHVQLALSPASIEFARSMGGTGLHVGILGALPILLFFMQLVAALVAGRFDRRKPLWFVVSIAQRLVYLPLAIGPWFFPDTPGLVWVWLLVALTAANQALLHFSTPLWLSWMGDYLPHQALSRFWGLRHRWTQWSAAGSLLLVALLYFKSVIDIRASFGIVLGLAVVLGVTDILLFIGVEEPCVQRHKRPGLRQALAAPFRHRDFRSFIFFSCFWNLACMVGAPFISLYLLDYVGMDLFHVLLLWTISWVGGSLCSQKFGALVDTHGQRPVLILCTAFKSIVMASLLIAPRDPKWAFWLLIPPFMIDAFLNSGITIANNGFLLKNSPREDRTMFIAAGTAFAGLIGGITPITAGAALVATNDWCFDWHGMVWINYHWAFAASFALRLVSAVLALSIRESGAHGTRFVVTRLAGLTLPWLRIMAPNARRHSVQPLGWLRTWFVRRSSVRPTAAGDEPVAAQD